MNGSAPKPFLFERLAPKNQCGATIIAMASLTERLALAELNERRTQRSFVRWDDVLHKIDSQSETRPSPVKRSEWLNPEHPSALKKGNETSLTRFAEAVAEVLATYVRADGPLSRAAAVQASGDVSEFLQCAIAIFGQYASAPERVRTLIDADPAARAKNDLIKTWCQTLFPEGQQVPSHPVFPSRSLFDPVLLQGEFLPLRIEDDHDPVTSNCDLYAVVREARGWVSQTPTETNMLVRDLLWIRYSRSTHPTFDIDRARNSSVPIGIYVSAMDGCCFHVETIDRKGPNVILTARSEHSSRDAERLTMIFSGRESREPLRIRDGILSGCAGANSRLAAWKCLVVRPDWPFFYQLRTLIHDMMFKDIRDLYRLCAEINAVGVIHADAIRHEPDVRLRRDAFRHLLLDGTRHPGHSKPVISSYIESQLKSLLQDKIDLLGDDPAAILAMIKSEGKNVSNLLIGELTHILRNNWHLVEPAQIVSYRRDTGTYTHPNYRERMNLLLGLRNVAEYGAEW